MSMFYQVNLGVFAVGSAFLLYQQYRRENSSERAPRPLAASQEDGDSEDGEVIELGGVEGEDIGAIARQFKVEFFLVYALAVAADWLQGPHIYAIYKYEKGIEEQWVAALYAAGFVSGALSASFAGELADRYGRRLACLVYCGSYALTCATMFSNNFTVLFFGRLCGGISTTLLFSVFEAWMITEFHRRGLETSHELTLSSVFGYMTTVSCMAAIVSGIVGDVLVSLLGGRVWPFVASIVCSVLAAVVILTTWRENYGSKSTSQNTLSDVKSGVWTILKDTRILALGITSCFFEGAMYLFIFFWSAALKSARAKSGSDEELPYGLIFSSFMCSMMAGSCFFSLFRDQHTRESTSFLLMCATLLVSSCFSAAVLLEYESMLFWALCAIEACIGVYFPSMSFLKSEVVEDDVRGRVYSILRLPLNVFVVVVHSLDSEGDAHRNHVFMILAAMLMLCFFVVQRTFGSG
ncbi:major facilitator superfamily transporter [Thozetella sp. PMI_491]|nr:major facilitator superfamily transporter [Thozetella sp. PMI_491]